jgi:hypothetical protein
MYICYVDEAGDTAPVPAANSPVQPTIVLTALILNQTRIRQLTYDFLAAKRTYFPKYCGKRGHQLEDMMVEIKGSVLRREIRDARKLRRHHFGYLDRVFEILEDNEARYTASIWVKALGQPLDGMAVYTTSVQAMCRHFQEFLVTQDAYGVVVADFRTPWLNARVSHAIFTQKFKAAGDAFGRILEMPTFGHSENHAGIQIGDYMCSTLLFPMATHTYCAAHMPASPHVHPIDEKIKARYAPILRKLQYRYYRNGMWRGGIAVDDKLGNKQSRLMVTL